MLLVCLVKYRYIINLLFYYILSLLELKKLWTDVVTLFPLIVSIGTRLKYSRVDGTKYHLVPTVLILLTSILLSPDNHGQIIKYSACYVGSDSY